MLHESTNLQGTHEEREREREIHCLSLCHSQWAAPTPDTCDMSHVKWHFRAFVN